MSRIRRLSQVISEEGRRTLASQQAAKIRDAAFSIVDQANLNASTTRKVTKKAAFTVVLRSLQSTRDLPFSLREHMAIKELSQYITLAQSDKSHALTLSNTDLLPVSHPRSTRNHSMTASALLEARARWIADDPRIIDGYAKTIIASALTSEYSSVEHTYYCSVLSNLPQGVVPADVLLAAGNPFSGGNSSAERSMRARLQRRDREGKFAFMGGGLSALIRRKNGKVYNLVGRPVIDGPNGDDIQMQLPDGKIVNIPASKGMFVKAIINPTPDGFSKDTAKTATTDNIINEEDLVYLDSPEGWKKVEDGVWEGSNAKNAGLVVRKTKDGKYDARFVMSSGSEQELGEFGDWEDVLDGIAEWDENGNKPNSKNIRLPENKFVEPALPPIAIDKESKPINGPDKQEQELMRQVQIEPNKKFEFEYPAGAIKMKVDESYDPEGRIDENSPDFTDDPAELANIFDSNELLQALEQGVLPEQEGDNAVGYGVLRFNGGDEYVPVQAIYNALNEQGEDAPLELARIYDKGLGGNNNEDALNDNRKGVARLDQAKPDVAESFERTIAQSPDEVPATEEPKFDSAEMDQVPLPPVLEGLSDAEMNQFMETKDHTPYLPENESIDMPEGYNTLDSSPFQSWREVTAETPDAVLPEGFSDNPVFLAQSIEKEKLEAELRRSLEPDSATPGYANISLQDEDGEEFIANVPGEAVRDALQLQGVDTNELIKSIADEGFAGQKSEEPIAELPEEPSSVEDAIKADEDYIEKMKNLYGYERDKALRDYKQQGPHDPLDPAYNDEFKNQFEEYLSEDDSPNGIFNDLLRANPDFARLFAWHQFDQTDSPIHADYQPSDSDARERFDAEDAKHALVEGKYGNDAPTPAVAVGAGLNILMAPDYFYFNKKEKIDALKDALDAFKNEDMRNDLRDDKAELDAVDSVIKSIEDEIAKLEAPKSDANVPTPEALDNEEAVPDISEPLIQSESVAAIDVDSPNLQEEIQSAINKGQKIAFSYNGKERVVFPKEIWINPKNGNVNLRAIEDGTDGGLKVFTLDKMEMAKGVVPSPAESKPKELSEGDKAVIKNNAYVEENAGTLQPTEAKNLKVGDFLWAPFFGRYEEILAMEPADMGRIKFTVFNVYNNKQETRYFEMDSPLRNVRRPGIEDQAEPILPAKGAKRGGPRGLIKRAPLSERQMGKEGRKVAKPKGNVEIGLYQDKNGVPLKPGDVVVNPKRPELGRGVVKNRIGDQVEEGKKAGGQVRAGKLQANKVIIQFEHDAGPGQEWILQNAGREFRAAALEIFDGDIDDLVINPNFRGGAVVPNRPAAKNVDKADVNVPEQGKLLDTPEAKPAAPALPDMPKPIYKAEVQDQKDNKFTVSVIKIGDMYEAAVFTEDNKLSAVIAKNTDFAEVQSVVGRFIGDVAAASDGEKVLRTYGGLPDPAEQLKLTRDVVAIPELPEVKKFALRDAKIQAKDLAARVQQKDLPSADEIQQIDESQKTRMKAYIMEYLEPGGVDRRNQNKFVENLDVAQRYAMQLGWFDEAQEIAALKGNQQKIALRPADEQFNANVANLRDVKVSVGNAELELYGALETYEVRKNISNLMDALEGPIIYPDPYNPNFRNGMFKAKDAIKNMIDDINNNPNKEEKHQAALDKLNGYKEALDAFGDLPKIGGRATDGSDKEDKRMAEIAREFEGLRIEELANGHGDWKPYKVLSAGINKVYLLRNALTGEHVVIKYDDDHYERSGGIDKYFGNGIRSEEMVAQLYRDLGFAQPAFRAVNPGDPDRKIGGVGVMEYAETGFFGLADIQTHGQQPVYNIDQVIEEHRAEVLNFVIGNAIIGNTDRHGGNFMWGRDPVTGKARIVPIDNGLSIFNAAFNKAEKHQEDPLYVNPLKVIVGDYGNFNGAGSLAKQWIKEIGNVEAERQIIEFAKRMRDRAEALEFIDSRASQFLMTRAEYVMNNPSKFIDKILNFW